MPGRVLYGKSGFTIYLRSACENLFIMSAGMSDIAIIIPAYDPSEKILELVSEISTLLCCDIIVVNDGSSPESWKLFVTLEQNDSVTVLRHAVNLGKGAALKTAFNYILLHKPDVRGVVTADGDGQHLPNDILRVAEDFLGHPDSLVLGVRSFATDVPWKSLVGNVLTKFLLWTVAGIRCRDTQTGLRAIPRVLLADLVNITVNRYEFEMEMLLKIASRGIPMREVSIKTVYIDENRASHFNPLTDSVRIYFVLLRYVTSSVVTVLADYTAFTLAWILGGGVVGSLATARAVSILLNFTLNKYFVFFARHARYAFMKYLTLVIVSGGVCCFLMSLLYNYLSVNIILSKVIAELLLYLPNFVIQRDLIFKKRAFPSDFGK